MKFEGSVSYLMNIVSVWTAKHCDGNSHVLFDPMSATHNCDRVSPHARQCQGVISVCAAG